MPNDPDRLPGAHDWLRVADEARPGWLPPPGKEGAD
jgi:hypothetical protein